MKFLLKLIFIFVTMSAYALKYDYVSNEESFNLPKMGNFTCSVINKHSSNNSLLQRVCSATILSNHQIAYDQRCLIKNGTRDASIAQLSCMNGSYIRNIPKSTNLRSKLTVFKLDKPLPLVSFQTNLNTTINDNNYKKCYAKSASRYIGLKPLDQNVTFDNEGKIKTKIYNSSDIGASVICQDKNNNEVLIGVVDENFRIKNLGQIDKESKIADINELIESNEENINVKCIESQECLTNLSGESAKLTSDTLLILKKLNNQFKQSTSNNKELTEGIDELELTFESIRLECNKLATSLKMQDDDKIDTGILSSIMGSIESFGISTIELFDDEFLLDQFKNVKIIGENLSNREIKDIFEKTQNQNKNLSNIELIKKATAAFTDKIVDNMAKSMDIARMSASRYDDFKKTTRKDLDKCLSIADSKDKILECSDKFAKTASIKIAEIELENQLEENFKKQFNNIEDYLNLTISAKDTYYRCINQFFYKQTKVDNSKAVKGCVLQSMLTAFNKTKDITLRKYIVDSGVKADEVGPILSKIILDSKSCNNYDIIYSVNSNSENDLLRLSNIDAEDFKTYLFDCIEKLSITAGKEITLQTVKNHPQINQLVNSPSEISTIARRASDQLFKNCIEKQEKTKDANRCKEMITAITTLSVAKKEISKTIDDLAKNSPKTREELRQKTSIFIDKCSEELEKKHLSALSGNSTTPNEQETVACLKNTVLILVEDVTNMTVKETISKEEIAKPYLNEILKDNKILQIGKKVSICFDEKLKDSKSINDFTDKIDSTKETCQFMAEKEATSIIAPIVLINKLTDAINNQAEAKKIADSYTKGERGLVNRLLQASSKGELTSVTNQITLDLTIKGANFVIPNLVEEMLGKFPTQVKNRISKGLVTSLTNCILNIDKNSPEQNKETDECINKSTKKGYFDISSELIYKNIDDVLGTDAKITEDIFVKSKNRFRKCADNIPTNQPSDSYKGIINLCMIDEVAQLSYEIPREAILLYAPASGLAIPSDQMRKKLIDIESYYINPTAQKSSLPTKSGNFILDSHFLHMKCIAETKEKLKKTNETDMSIVQSAYSKCTDNVEKNIKLGIAEIFASKHSSNAINYLAMYNLGRTLIQLTSNEPESKETSQKSTSERKPLSETFTQMHLVGSKFKTACESMPNDCIKVAKETLKDVTDFKETHSKATGDELFDKFINSTVMEFVINSEISNSLNSELKNGMKDYLDERDILLTAINEITSPESIKKLMKTNDGKLALQKIINAIKNNTIDDIMKDNNFRSIFASVLTNDTSNDSFVDKLIFGVVQPKVLNEKQTSNGLFGILRNPKVSLGRLFGIVSSSDFDWLKIRETKEGKRAREIFAKEIFAPIVRGENLENIPSSRKKYKNKIDELSAQIEDLIAEGVKNL